MRIAVIGTGNVGQALGGSLARAGHQVVFAAQDQAKTHEVASKLGATAATSVPDAARQADVIVLAVPYGAAEEVARSIGDAASGKVVIDVTNPIKHDMSGLSTEGGPSAAERNASAIPGAKVVKAFNTLFASVQADPKMHGQTIDVLYAADDPDARAKTAELIESLGFRPVYVGALANAKELEALAWLNIRLQIQQSGTWNTAIVLLNAPQSSLAKK